MQLSMYYIKNRKKEREDMKLTMGIRLVLGYLYPCYTLSLSLEPLI